MSTFTLTPALRATLKAALKGSTMIVIGTNGVISNFGSVIHLDPKASAKGATYWTVGGKADIGKVLNADSITFEGGKVSLTKGLATRDLKVSAYDAGPEGIQFWAPTGDPVVTVSSQDSPTIRARFRLLETARSDDATLPILTGVHARTEGDDLIWSATDRYRVVAVKTPARGADLGAVTGGEGVIVPGELLAAAGKRASWSLDVHQDGATLTLPEFDGATVTMRAIDGSYPKVAGLFPADPTPWVRYDDPVSLAATVKDMNVPRNEPFMLTDRGEAGAEATKLVAVGKALTAANGEEAPSTVGLNPYYFTTMVQAACKAPGKGHEALGALTVCTVTNSSAKPVHLAFEGDDTVKALLMPVRLPQGGAAFLEGRERAVEAPATV